MYDVALWLSWPGKGAGPDYYELMESEGLPYTKIGKSLRFPYHSLKQWVERRMQSSAA